MTPTMTAYRSGRDGFWQLLRAEWTKFRTVRGWLISLAGSVVLIVAAVLVVATHSYVTRLRPSAAVIGPAGVAVTDQIYFVHQPLDGDGSITARVTSLTGVPGESGGQGTQAWAKAGVIMKAGTRPGSAYAAIMVTPGHGVQLQYDFTHDLAGPPGAVSPADPRWLRLTRSGSEITGYASADGTHWTAVGMIRLTGLPPTLQAGLFTASPDAAAGQNGTSTTADAVFDQVSRQGTWPHPAWTGTQVDKPAAPAGGRFSESGGRFTVAGPGDAAPYVPVDEVQNSLISGELGGLIVIIVLGTMFITAEYRRGMIRTTLVASPRRGRVLLAKAIVIGVVTFVAGLVAAAVALPIAGGILRHNIRGYRPPTLPVTSLADGAALRAVLGTGALLAAAAILALGLGTALRRSAGAVAAVIALLILPYFLAVNLPMGTAQGLLRFTPAAAFAAQETVTQYPQLSSVCRPQAGCFPLEPSVGLAVLCGYAVAALGLGIFLLRRRDA